ncbi:hypothetical protein NB689_001431 [Xanthomonas sacchari]|nr:hypothetical protein [Xanthomonas sacchari]MCW0449081.1 hypothetical protein [Xanthomonas sacchari]
MGDAPLSVADTVKLKLPLPLGVPVSTPAELSSMPTGNVPVVIAKPYGAVPPLAVKVWL